MKHRNEYILPIISGSKNFRYFWPDYAYININDYENTTALVDELKSVMADETSYMKHFVWKDYYAVETNNPFCVLCVKLNEPHVDQLMEYYNDVYGYFL